MVSPAHLVAISSSLGFTPWLIDSRFPTRSNTIERHYVWEEASWSFLAGSWHVRISNLNTLSNVGYRRALFFERYRNEWDKSNTESQTSNIRVYVRSCGYSTDINPKTSDHRQREIRMFIIMEWERYTTRMEICSNNQSPNPKSVIISNSIISTSRLSWRYI